MCATSGEGENFTQAPALALSISRTGNFASVWELVLTSNIRPHCVPVALVAIAVCVVWLRGASSVWAPIADIGRMQPVGIGGVACGMLAVSVAVLSVRKLLQGP